MSRFRLRDYLNNYEQEDLMGWVYLVIVVAFFGGAVVLMLENMRP